MTFGDSDMPHADDKSAFDILDAFVEAGGNFIDTANVRPGDSEV